MISITLAYPLLTEVVEGGSLKLSDVMGKSAVFG